MPLPVLTDAVGFVRSHPEMFLPSASPSAVHCLQHLVTQVFALGAQRLNVERREGWWIVSSELDWFAPNQSSTEQVQKLIPLPEVGANASRVEVVLMAFAAALATKTSREDWQLLSGAELPPTAADASESGRTLAFRF